MELADSLTYKSQINPFHTLPSFFFKIYFNTIILPIPSKQPLSFRPSYQPQHGFVFCPMHPICPAILTLLNLITPILQYSLSENYYLLLPTNTPHIWVAGWLGYVNPVKKLAGRTSEYFWDKTIALYLTWSANHTQFSVAFSYFLVGKKKFLSLSFLNTLSPCPSLNMRSDITHTHTYIWQLRLYFNEF